MTIKPMTEAFAEKIAEVNEKYFPDGWNLNVLKESFNSGRFFVFGAFNEKEELVAYISYSVAADSADIEDVFVIPEERGKKISSSLAEYALIDLKGTMLHGMGYDRHITMMTMSHIKKKDTVKQAYYSKK